MLTKDDLKQIANFLEPIHRRIDELKRRLAIKTKSTKEIEHKIDNALELRKDVAEVRNQVKDHEERISNLE